MGRGEALVVVPMRELDEQCESVILITLFVGPINVQEIFNL